MYEEEEEKTALSGRLIEMARHFRMHSDFVYSIGSFSMILSFKFMNFGS